MRSLSWIQQLTAKAMTPSSFIQQRLKEDLSGVGDDTRAAILDVPQRQMVVEPPHLLTL